MARFLGYRASVSAPLKPASSIFLHFLLPPPGGMGKRGNGPACFALRCDKAAAKMTHGRAPGSDSRGAGKLCEHMPRIDFAKACVCICFAKVLQMSTNIALVVPISWLVFMYRCENQQAGGGNKKLSCKKIQ